MSSRLFARVVLIATIVAPCAVVLATTVVAAGSTPTPHLFGTSTTAPTRPTVTAPRPTTPPTDPTIPGRPTTTTAVTTTTTATTATTEGDVPSPPTAPPATPPPATSPPATQEVETAAQIIQPASPPPGLLPPVITFVTTTCADANSSNGTMEARIIDPPANQWFYPVPFWPEHTWELRDGPNVLASDQSVAFDWISVVVVDALAFGAYELVVANEQFPELIDAAAVVVSECGTVVTPLPPSLELTDVSCVDGDGSGSVAVTVGNPGGDDGSDRQIDVEISSGGNVVGTASQNISDGVWFGYSDNVPLGAIQIAATDHDDPDLAVVLDTVVGTCVEPPPDPSPTLAPVIVGVTAECASADDGVFHAAFADPNPVDYQSPPPVFTHTLSQAGSEVASNSIAAYLNASTDIAWLAPGDYEFSVAWASDPSLVATAPVTVHDCATAPAPSVDPVPSVLWTTCDPYITSRTLVSLWNPDVSASVNKPFTWWLSIDGGVQQTGSAIIYSGHSELIGLTGLQPGDYELLIFDANDSGSSGTTSWTVGPCADPTDPTGPTSPPDPSGPTTGGGGTATSVPPVDSTASTASQPAGGTLPATGSGLIGLVLGALALVAIGSLTLVRGSRKQP